MPRFDGEHVLTDRFRFFGLVQKAIQFGFRECGINSFR
jgi:hypothetical protein